MSLSFTDQVAAMEGEVKTLRQLWTQLAATVPLIDGGTAWVVTDVSDGSAPSGSATLLKTLNTAIANLDADRTRVFSGLRSFDSWWGEAQAHESTLRSSLGEAANYSFAGAVTYTANETAKTVKDKLPLVAGIGFGVLVLVLVLVLAVKLA